MEQNKRAASMTDALVVLGILIASLFLLLPVISRAGEDARSAECLNNLRQLGKAHSLYHADFDDWFIPHNYNQEPFNVPASTWNWPVGLLELEYISGSEIMLCPAGVEMDLGFVALVRSAGHPAWGQYVHYGYNYGYIGSSDQLGRLYPERTHFEIWRPAKVFEVRNPSEKILHGDTAATYRFPYMPYKAEPHHSGGINILWADGNVSRMENPSEKLDGSTEAKRLYLDRRY